MSCVKAGKEEGEAGKETTPTDRRSHLNERIRDLTSTLEAMDQHVGMMLLRQRSKCQLVSAYYGPNGLVY